MIERANWFDREFSFDLPVWMYPNILERLRGTPARIDDRIKALTQEGLTKRDPDSWSVQENVGHILDLEPLWIGRLDDFLSGKEELREADLSNKETYEADHNSKPIADILSLFQSVRNGFVARLEGCDEPTVLRTSTHPRLKTEIRLLDLVYFVAEHDDHHLARISQLVSRVG